MRGSRLLAVTIGAALVIVAACVGGDPTLVESPFDGSTDGAPTTDVTDETSLDATADPACLVTSDASIYTQDFEDGGAPCNGWSPANATLDDGPGRCAPRACKMCRLSPSGEARMTETLAIARGAGTYRLNAWVRSDDDDGGPWGLRFEGTAADGGNPYAGNYPTGVAGPEYSRVAASFTTTAPVERVRVVFFKNANDPTCLVVDDLTVEHYP